MLALDNVKMNWWQAHRPTTRRLIQLYSALLQNAHIRGFIDGEIYQGKAKYACVPGFNCYSCPGAIGACPLGSIQNALASTGHRAGWYVLGIIMLAIAVAALVFFAKKGKEEGPQTPEAPAAPDVPAE